MGEEALHVRCAAHGAPVNLRQGEVGIVCSNDRIRRAADAYAAAQDEAVGSHHYGHFAFVDGAVGEVVAAVHLDDGAAVGGELLDVHAGAEALALGAD